MHRQKQQLMAQCDATRRQFIADWRRLKSPEMWLGEMTGFARRHPWWIVSAATIAGTVAAKTMRHNGAPAKKETLSSRIGRLSKFVSVAFSVWKLFQRRRSQSTAEMKPGVFESNRA